jgi:hypothetical protein
MLWTIRRRMREWARNRVLQSPGANRISVQSRAKILWVINISAFMLAFHMIGVAFSNKIYTKMDPDSGERVMKSQQELDRYSFSAKILPQNVSDVIRKKQLERAKAELVDIENEELS